MTNTIARKLMAEFMGTMFLLAAVVGSGIMGERLAVGNVAIALLANSIATGAVLMALILALGPVSKAHFNPAVTLAAVLQGAMTWRAGLLYMAAQLGGAFAGVGAAHLMFREPLFFASLHARSGLAQCFSEFLATFGLLMVIRGCSRLRPEVVAVAVGGYIAGAYWFTASTSFANPAVTLARAATNTFAGIRAADVPGFLLAQFAGALIAAWLCGWMMKHPEREI